MPLKPGLALDDKGEGKATVSREGAKAAQSRIPLVSLRDLGGFAPLREFFAYYCP